MNARLRVFVLKDAGDQASGKIEPVVSVSGLGKCPSQCAM